MVYSPTPFAIRQSETFRQWLADLDDREAVARIAVRIRRASLGNLGDAKSVGKGVSEMRIDYGPGYRVYFTRRGQEVILLLCGGDKKTQARDIDRAQKMVADLD
jgi:putative addiction module killer protein